jgi:hypothetical protein
MILSILRAGGFDGTESLDDRIIELRKNDSAVHDSAFNHVCFGSGSAG